MSKIIISDTSCLIALDGIGQLQILQKLFFQVSTTQEISDEFGKKMPDWIVVKPVKNSIQKNELETVLDKGEASALPWLLKT